MPVAEIFVSAFIQVLLDRLASRELLEFATRQGIHPRLKKLEGNLKMIAKVITHAENMLLRATEVDEWLEELREWVYDADDFLDEVNTRAGQHKQQVKEEAEEAKRNTTSIQFWDAFKGTKVRGFLYRGDDFFGFKSGKQSKDADELNSRLDTISERMGEMRRLMKMTLPTDNTPNAPLPIYQIPLEAPAEEFNARVFGREQEEAKILEQLKSSKDADVEVIPIVGMPGIGKTTLARHVLESLQQQQQQQPRLFDIKGWVCVSDDFDVNRITRDILESFTSRACDLRGLNQLQSQLKEVVGGKRFLLVLDDVWSRDYYRDWAPLRSPFRVGAPGSKILVTTRDDKVASMMQTDDPTKIHHLGALRDDDCWSVFLQHVVDKRSSVLESEAGRFRMKILDKCRGLPLTAKLLAGVLRGESPGRGWEAKLNSSIWDVSKNVELSGRKGGHMLPVVMLSYYHLPPRLKCCFSYCSVFPEDYEFEEEDVVVMWIAQGLVFAEGGEQVEATGAKYFRELVSRSLFQPSPNNPSRFVMHDLINDMAEIVAGKSCFKFDGDRKIESDPAQARYSSYRRFRGLKTKFEAFERTKYLRAFQSFDPFKAYGLTSYVPLELLMKLKYLRVLCLSHYDVKELPEDIGDLIHLRLVDLSDTYLRKLPESISNLYNLLVLKLQGCPRLMKLPAETSKLVNLRNLDCSAPNRLVAMPVEMGKLTSLQKLSSFIVGEGLEQGIDQLKYLSNLNGSISISFLENVRDSKEAREAKLMSKEGLQSLELKWKMDSDHGDLQGTVFAELQPHKHLEKLIINGYSGVLFPGWVGDDRFSKMRVIKLEDCEKCTSLPPLGKLPVLEEIQIRKMGGIECVGGEFYGKEIGAFPSLKILTFEFMENWSIWLYPAGGGFHFACLQELHVINCPKLLMSLPDGINVQKLKVRRCDELLIALPRPSMLEMDIRECRVEWMECLQEDGDASQLTKLKIEKVDVVEAVGSARIISNKEVVEAHRQMMMLGSLTALEMTSIPKLTHLPGVVLQGLPKLKTLAIYRCKELKSLWKMDNGEMEIGGLNFVQKQASHFLNFLRFLDVEECPQLDCLVVPQHGEEDDKDRDTDISEKEEMPGTQQCPGLPCGLETLRLSKCDKLEKLPSDLHNLSSLRELYVLYCRRLSCLLEMGFPSNLESLFISGCELLTCLSSSSSSSSSSSMGLGGNGNGIPLPHSLKDLNICRCENLESLVSTNFTSAGSFPSLESLQIHDCPKLKSLPEGIHRHRRLKYLTIEGCHNLSISSIRHFTALERLGINGWPAGLLSIQRGQGGPDPNSLPHNLRALELTGPSLTPPNDEQVFFFSAVPLPSSLTTLLISKSKKLSPEAFRNLTSLQQLRITDSPELTSIPDQLLPPSLRNLYVRDCPALTSIPDQLLPLSSLSNLYIRDCPALTSIPDQLLPPSLLSLHITACPLLAPDFAKGKGRYWPKLKFIPEVLIDRRSIFEAEEED